MNRLVIARVVLIGLCYSICGWAQLDLGQLWARDVKQGYSVEVQAESLLVSTSVRGGVARSSVEMVLKPLGYPLQPQTFDLSRPDGSIETVLVSEKILDSIEISLWFSLPTNFAASSMALWVNGEPQEAYVQDRALAREQYNDIVGRRLDPALLECQGGGNYYLQIFPAVSNVARRIRISFEHTLDDDEPGVITAALPFTYSKNTWAEQSGELQKSQMLGYVSFELDAPGGYTLTVPGLGSAVTMGSTGKAQLSGSGIAVLGAGSVSASDPSGGDEFLWVGKDKDQRSVAGFSHLLEPTNLNLESEPSVRVIVFDIRQARWDWNDYYRKLGLIYGYSYDNYDYGSVDLLARAKKYAVMALKQHVDKDELFNIVFAAAEPSALFATPQPPTEANLASAFAAIVAATAEPLASTPLALSVAAAQSERSAVILISDLYSPADYYKLVNKPSGPELSDVGIAFDSLIAQVKEVALSVRMNLFTISDEWRLNEIATTTGGLNVASLRWTWYPYQYDYSTAQRLTIAGIPALQELYGPGRWNPYSRIAVAVSGLEQLAWTTDNSYGGYWWRGGGIMMDGLAMAKRTGLSKATSMVLPYSLGTDSVMLRVAGFKTGSGAIDATISGMYGGLSFSKQVRGVPGSVVEQLDSVVQWAWLHSEQLGQDDWYGFADSIKALGKQYHLATRQTSLLALEPGMILYPDTAGQNNSKVASDQLSGSSEMVADSYRGQYDLDSVSLDQIIAGVLSTPAVQMHKAGGQFRAKVRGLVLEVTLPAGLGGERTELVLADLAGRTIARWRSDSHRVVADGSRIAVALSKGGLARGTYLVTLDMAAKRYRTTVTVCSE